MEELSYEKITMRKKNRSLFMFIISLSLSGLLIYFLYYIFTPHIKFPDNFREPYIPIPKQYCVNDSYLLPVWNQFDRGTCWSFASIYMLESSYKHQGILNGYLNNSEYVAFSQEGLAKYMVKKCLSDPTTEVCKKSPRRHNKSNSGSIEDFLSFYEYYSDMKSSILPIAGCPYQQLPENELQCPDFDKHVSTNPIEFDIEDPELAIGIQKVKELIVKVQRPVTFSIPLPVTRYWYECNDKNPKVMESKMCQESLYRCQHDPSKFCSFMDYQLSKPNTAEMITHNSDSISYGVGHAMVMVGYNDNLIEPLPVNITRKPPSKGGFILRNSWGARGHSLEYLMGKISHDQEMIICPNPGDVMTWIPVSHSCISSQGIGSQCSKDIKRFLGNSVFVGGTELTCKNSTHCKEGDKYYLLRNGNYPSPVIEFSPLNVPLARVIHVPDMTIELIETIPFEHLYYAFTPSLNVTNNNEHCGYVGLMYDSVDALLEQLGPVTPSWRAITFKVTFTKSSYERSKSWKNYSLVKQSTSVFKPISSKSPVSLHYSDL